MLIDDDQPDCWMIDKHTTPWGPVYLIKIGKTSPLLDWTRYYSLAVDALRHRIVW